MPQNQEPKLWHPAHFTHKASRGPGDEPSRPSIDGRHIVIILNNPLEDKDLLLDICNNGMHDLKARIVCFIG